MLALTAMTQAQFRLQMPSMIALSRLSTFTLVTTIRESTKCSNSIYVTTQRHVVRSLVRYGSNDERCPQIREYMMGGTTE